MCCGCAKKGAQSATGTAPALQILQTAAAPAAPQQRFPFVVVLLLALIFGAVLARR